MNLTAEEEQDFKAYVNIGKKLRRDTNWETYHYYDELESYLAAMWREKDINELELFEDAYNEYICTMIWDSKDDLINWTNNINREKAEEAVKHLNVYKNLDLIK